MEFTKVKKGKNVLPETGTAEIILRGTDQIRLNYLAAGKLGVNAKDHVEFGHNGTKIYVAKTQDKQAGFMLNGNNTLYCGSKHLLSAMKEGRYISTGKAETIDGQKWHEFSFVESFKKIPKGKTVE